MLLKQLFLGKSIGLYFLSTLLRKISPIDIGSKAQGSCYKMEAQFRIKYKDKNKIANLEKKIDVVDLRTKRL